MQFFGWLGRSCSDSFLYIIDVFYFIARVMAIGQPHRNVFNRAVYSVLLGQLIYTGVDAFLMISFLAVVVGIGIISELIYIMHSITGANDITEILARLLVSEMGPLITSVILIGRSCSAMTVDLGNTKVRGEIAPLEYLGINADDYFIVPRILCMVICQVILALYFSTIMLFCGIFFGAYIHHFPAINALMELVNTLNISVVISFLIKNVMFGFIIGTMACFHGLSVQNSPTQVPQQMQKAVVRSLLFISLVDGYFFLLVL